MVNRKINENSNEKEKPKIIRRHNTRRRKEMNRFVRSHLFIVLRESEPKIDP